MGRQDELDLVVSGLVEGTVTAVVIGGAAGVGKTRLATEAAADLAARGWSVERIGATLSSSFLPFGAFARLLPMPSGGTPQAAVETIRAVTAALAARGRSASGRLVLVIDDAHHLDEFSAVLVHQLVVEGTIRILATVRSGESLHDPLVAVWKDGWGTRIDLLELSEVEVAELLRRVLEGEVEPSTSEALWRATSGHVLLLHELVLDAVGRGALVSAGGAWRWRDRQDHGVRLREVVAGRLGNLTAPERRAVELLSLSEPLPIDVLADLAPEADLETLERRAVLRLETDGLRQTAFMWHPILAEVVRSELRPPLRRAHAASLVAKLREAGVRRRTDILRLALLQLDASDTSRPDELAQAAMEANALPDPATAERLARVAYRVRPEALSALALAEAVAQQGRPAEAEPILLAALDLPADDAVLARVAWNLAQLYQESGRAEEAFACLATARDRAQDLSWSQVIQGHRIQLAVTEGRTRTGGEEGESLLARAVDGKVRLRLVTSVVPMRALRGQTEDALSFAASVVPDAFAFQRELPLGMTWAFVARAVALFFAGQLHDGEAHAAMARAASDGLVSSDNFSVLALLEGRLAIAGGRTRVAADALRQAIPGLGRTRHYQYWAFALLAEAEALRGNRDAAQAAAARAIAAPAVGAMEGDARRALAGVLALGGERTTAIEQLRHIAESEADEARYGVEILVRYDAYRFGDRSQAPLVLQLSEGTDGLWGRTIAAHVGAGEADDAAGLDASSAAFEDQGALLFSAECAAAASLAYDARGLKAKSAAARRRVEELRLRCDVAQTPILSEVGTNVRLTRREREVVELAARGFANAAIAERLFVGVRTVEGHLLRAFAKLGVSDRGQLQSVVDGG